MRDRDIKAELALPRPARTLAEVGAIMGIPRQTVQVIERRALRKLRKRLRRYCDQNYIEALRAR